MINIDLENNPINITEHIKKFRQFLVASNSHVLSLMEHHNWDDDGSFFSHWLQVNWEILVERELLEGKAFLTQFSTACVSSRITYPGNKPNYAVIAKSDKKLFDLRTKKPVSLDNPEKPLRLFSFRSMSEGSFCISPPYDIAYLVQDLKKELFLVPFSKLEFYLVKLV